MKKGRFKIEWNKVTWYSKFAAVVFFAATFWWGFYVGTIYQQTVDALLK